MTLWKKFAEAGRWVHILATTTASVAVVVVAAIGLWAYLGADAESPALMSEGEVQALCGWAGEAVARDEFDRLKESFRPFVIWDPAARAPAVRRGDKRSVLWDASLRVLGRHIPTFKQETGDCVSMGVVNAAAYLLARQIDQGAHQTFKLGFPPFSYGVSRVQIGGGRIPCGSAGSTGSWGALGAQKYGILPDDAAGLPSYSGRLADQWGCRPGPPATWQRLAAANVVKSVARVNTWQDVRDALVNGYPVTIASNVGFRGALGPNWGTVRAGKRWGTPGGTWAHQMAVIGYDVDPEPCFYIINSWGPAVHGAPVGNEPPGGFWVVAGVVATIVRQGDSFAFSDFDGFPRNDWNIDILKQKENVHARRSGVARGADPVGVYAVAP